MALIEPVAVAIGLAYIVLAIRQQRACWIAGGISTALFIVVFMRAGLPLQAALQVAYVALSVYGWVVWRPDGEVPARPRSWPLSRQMPLLAGVGVATAATAPLLVAFEASAAPLAESLGTWASVAATWMLARRRVEAWLWWIVIDVGLAGLFLSRGLAPTAALYLGFAVLAAVGWREWRRSMAAA
ncbi:MAG TPA: nicotinamide riboside transporter PnuC [Steroidobacteraceae bacterium]|nr:nicotinamide riboside transporter PnuC [Steroidobacteraceae bacterium]